MTRIHLENGTRPRRGLPVGLALFVGLLLAAQGCSAFFDAPTVRIADVRVSGIGLSGATADVVLEVVNPNGFALEAEELRYRLEFEDVEAREDGAAAESDTADGEGFWRLVASGETDQRYSVPADDRASITVRVPFDYSDVGRAAMSLVRQGSLRYRISGDVLFDAPVTNVRVPFDDTGHVGL